MVEYGKPHYHKDRTTSNQSCGKFRLVICCDYMRRAWNRDAPDPNEDQDGFHINDDGQLQLYFEGCEGGIFKYCNMCGSKVVII